MARLIKLRRRQSRHHDGAGILGLLSLMKFLQIALSGDKNQTVQEGTLYSEATKQEVRKVVTSQRNLKFPSLSLEMVRKQVSYSAVTLGMSQYMSGKRRYTHRYGFYRQRWILCRSGAQDRWLGQ